MTRNLNYRDIKDAAQEIGVPYQRLYQAVLRGYVSSTVIAKKKLLDDAQIKKATEYFLQTDAQRAKSMLIR